MIKKKNGKGDGGGWIKGGEAREWRGKDSSDFDGGYGGSESDGDG